jgi:hypothetical protein
MMTGTTASLLALLAVSAAVPHLLARETLRARLVRLDAVSTVVLLATWHLASVLGVDTGAALASGVLLASKIILFVAVMAPATESPEVEWSPGRAGLVAGLVYLALIPNVLAWPVDGDESFYVLSAESMIRDFDLDLSNQYRNLDSSITGRLDLEPQPGDPVGLDGEIYSRHEPLLSALLVPGILAGGLGGALVTIALLAALAVRAIVALLEREGVARRAQLVVFAFVGLAPPFLNYAVRIWPEVPGALLLAEMLRAARDRKVGRIVLLGVLLSALKLRFVPIAVVLLLLVLVAGRVRARWLLAGVAVIAAMLAAIWIFLPGVFEARSFDARSVFLPDNYARGFLGVLLDGQAGLLFQAPLIFVGLGAVLRWRSLGEAAKLGCLTALPFLFLLLPRSEWHGGWSPPLRYLIVFMPVFALLVAMVVEKGMSVAARLAAAWTAGLAVCAVAFPPGLFRIASGESALGEHLSRVWGSDFSRLIPSLIRPDDAALWFAVGVVALIAMSVVKRLMTRRAGASDDHPSHPAAAALVSLVLAAGAWAGLQPGPVVELEDAHVEHAGGELYPEMWTVARFRFRGGWTLQSGDSVAFRHRGGMVSLAYYCDQPTVIEVDGETYEVPTGPDYADLVFVLPETAGDRHKIRCVTGALILDRLAAE